MDIEGAARVRAPSRIVIATIVRERGDTGVQTHVSAFYQACERRGVTVQVVTPFSFARTLSTPLFALRPVLVDRLSGAASVWWYRYWHYLFLLWALRRALRDGRPCSIYAQCPLSAHAALRARAGEHQRVVMVAHFNLSQAWEWAEMGKLSPHGVVYRSIRHLERVVLPQLDGIVYVSRFLKEQVVRLNPGVESVAAVIAPNFLPDCPVNRSVEFVGDVVTVGTLEPRKNHAYLLHVIAEARESGFPYRLTVIGDGPLRGMLERLAAELGIADLVSFVGRKLDARSLLAGFCIYAHAATMEASGLALIEAMATGLPVLTSAVGGIPELIDDGVEGVFWHLDDPADGSAKLIALLSDDHRRAVMSRAARRRFESQLAEDVVAERLLAFILHRRPSSAYG
jgi:glycosyltransferase involved in cell wall biosynthesis